MDCSLPGSLVHGILQARILEWVSMPSSRGSSLPRDQIHIPCVSYLLHWQEGSLPLMPPGKSAGEIPTCHNYVQRRWWLVISLWRLHRAKPVSRSQPGAVWAFGHCCSLGFVGRSKDWFSVNGVWPADFWVQAYLLFYILSHPRTCDIEIDLFLFCNFDEVKISLLAVWVAWNIEAEVHVILVVFTWKDMSTHQGFWAMTSLPFGGIVRKTFKDVPVLYIWSCWLSLNQKLTFNSRIVDRDMTNRNDSASYGAVCRIIFL